MIAGFAGWAGTGVLLGFVGRVALVLAGLAAAGARLPGGLLAGWCSERGSPAELWRRGRCRVVATAP
ncbi:MAG: hypothetical protein OXI18_12505 [bacterium]|nr:hypothetical protein [bacterium]